MLKKPLTLACVLLTAVLLAGASLVSPALAQGKKLKIGVVYDYTGPLAGGGSDLHALGAKIMIDYFAKRGGVEGYQIEAIYADAQSKPDVAINEAVRPRRAAPEVHVDHHVHLLGRAGEPQSEIRVPGAAERPPVRPDVHRLHRQERQGKARQGAQGPQDRHHPRGRRVRHRRLEGQRGGREEGRLQRRAEGRLRGHHAGPLVAGDQAQARAARRRVPHRLQPRHRAVPAPGARAGPEVQRARRPRGRLRRVRQAQGGRRQGRQPRLQRGPDLHLARQRQGAQARAGAADPDGGRGVRPGAAGNAGPLGPRRHGRQQHLRVHDGGPAARDQEVWRHRRRRAAEGGGVHFLGDGAMAGQNDRAFPVISQYIDDKAYVVWPKSLQHREPVLPLPASSPYAAN